MSKTIFECWPVRIELDFRFAFFQSEHKFNIPHITVGFLFSRLHPAGRRPPSSSVVRRRPPPRASHLTPLISHNSSHNYSSHTTHLTQLISHTTHLTQVISHNSSHTTHLTQFISHNSSHTIHLTHNSSHTTHLTQLISRTSSHRRVAWQAQYTEPSDGGAARIVAGVAAAALCVAGAVHRAS